MPTVDINRVGKRLRRAGRADVDRRVPILGAMQRAANGAWGRKPPRGQVRRRELAEARERLRFTLGLDPKELPSRDELETILTFYATGAASLPRHARIPRGQALVRWLQRLQAMLAPL